MVLIMTMTPLHMVEHGHDLGAVGLVLSAHTLGMFAFSPLSGWLSDRFGRVPTIFLGTAVLGLASLMAAFAPPDGGVRPPAGAVPAGPGVELRVRRGQRDALGEPRDPRAHPGPGRGRRADLELRRRGGLGSGLIMAAVGYTALGILAAAAVIIPLIVLRSHHGAHETGDDEAATSPRRS